MMDLMTNTVRFHDTLQAPRKHSFNFYIKENMFPRYYRRVSGHSRVIHWYMVEDITLNKQTNCRLLIAVNGS